MKPDKSHALNRVFEKQAKRERLEKARKALANKEYTKAKEILREDVEAPPGGTETGEQPWMRPGANLVAGSTPVYPPVASTHPDGTEPWDCDVPWTEHPTCENKRRVDLGLLPMNHMPDDEFGFVRRGRPFFDTRPRPLKRSTPITVRRSLELLSEARRRVGLE